MHSEAREELRVRFKLTVLEYSNHFGVTKTCQEFNVPRSRFYRWKQQYRQEGRAGLYRKSLLFITIHAKQLQRSLTRSWNCGASISSALYGLFITWSAIMASRLQSLL
jgi:transposase-like protein